MNGFTHYLVTGLLYRTNRRFSRTTATWRFAMGINLWRGSVWGVYPDGRRKLLKRVWN